MVIWRSIFLYPVGFVIGYAYDDRWGRWGSKFIKRRVIRLHPMVVMGAVIGGIMFYFQGCSVWDVYGDCSGSVYRHVHQRVVDSGHAGNGSPGLGEMYPLNGPSWSLFFEYIGNVLYALFIHKFFHQGSFALLVFAAGCGLAAFAILGPYGDICAGFSLTGTEFTAGFLRLMFSFSAGLLLFRMFKPARVKGAFWICSLSIVVLLSVPRLGGAENLWMNGLYDTVCFALFFPLLVYLGASGKTTDKYTTRICNFLGDISYPLYMVHYPFILPVLCLGQNEELTFFGSRFRCAGWSSGALY